MGMEKIKGDWKMAIAPVRASIGRTGFTDSMHKQEGDGHTPEGLYALGQLFSYDSIVPTRLPFIVVNEQDKWIDDSTSDEYNKYIRGATNAKSFEHLLLNSIEYKYCTVIEYNTDPVIKGKGSAIFFHVATPQYKTTAGCVAIAEKDMLTFLNWFHPKKKKSILIKGIYVEAD
jgi:L,D-peptidoglycan transpeptidase YkuD (ErfK/YbiS/YcfS/YnhG family)